MPLNINNIKQASPKANQVATEQYVDTSIAGIDVTQDISANNDTFAQSQGFSSYSDMATKYTALKKTIISGGYINTGLVNANSIVANSISADRLVAGTNSSTVWTGGGLISQNFNGNPYGNIGSPTQGFRLSSNAAGTSADPNIYGAYIKGATLEGTSLSVTDVKVKAYNSPLNFGKMISRSNRLGSNMSSLTSDTFISGSSGSGFNEFRQCTTSQIFYITGSLNDTLTGTLTLAIQVSVNGGGWTTIATKSGPLSVLILTSYVNTNPNNNSIAFMGTYSKNSTTGSISTILNVETQNGL